jgi:hypothetical protein
MSSHADEREASNMSVHTLLSGPLYIGFAMWLVRYNHVKT